MRKDMAKVIVERPRFGGGRQFPRAIDRRGDPDDLPSKEGMKRRHATQPKSFRKELNENLRPLERFLDKQVGKPWNKVFSEICENLKVTSAVQKHVRDHAKWMVEEHVTMVNRHPHRMSLGRMYPLRRNDLYVHPSNGILYKVNRQYKQNKK